MSYLFNVVPVSCQDMFMKKLINKNFGELILSDLEEYIYPLDDEVYTSQIIFDDLISFIQTDTSSGLYGKYTDEEITRFVNSCGVTKESIISWIKNWLNTTRVNKSIRMAFMSEPKTVNRAKPINNKKVKQYRKKLAQFNRPIVEITCAQAEIELAKGNDNVWAVRTKFGDFEPRFYKINDKRLLKDNYPIRYQFVVDTLCNYYQVREILFKTWVTLDDEHKFATQP